jgi:tetratricopeptide (TPR) repeat protein
MFWQSETFPTAAWHSLYKRLSKNNYSPSLEELTYFEQFTAHECKQLLDNPQSRALVVNTLHNYESSLKRLFQVPLKSANPHTHALLTWRLAHFFVHSAQYEQSRTKYLTALQTIQTDPELWLDYGRLEYNIGNVKEASDAFERAYALRDGLNVFPEQIWRWITKANLAYGNIDRSIDSMLELLDCVRKQPSVVGDIALQDRTESLQLLCGHLVQTLAIANQHEKAVHAAHILLMLVDGVNDASKLSSTVISTAECMVRLGRTNEARELADKYSKKLDNPIIKYIVESKLNRGFTAKASYFEALEAKTEPNSTTHNFIFMPDNSMVPAKTSARGSMYFMQATKCFSFGLFSMGSECIKRTAQDCIRAGDTTTLANCLNLLDYWSRFRGLSEDDWEFIREVRATDTSDMLLSIELGRMSLRQRDYITAKCFLEPALKSASSALVPWIKTMHGAALCGLGQSEIGVSEIEQALPRASEDQVPVLAYREAVNAAFEAGLWRISMRWAQRFFRDFLYLERDRWANDIADKGGRSALILGKYDEAQQLFQHMTRACAAHMRDTLSRSEGLITFDQFSAANLQWALSAALAGNDETARWRLEQVPNADRESTEYKAIVCLLLAKDQNHSKALEVLYRLRETPWLFTPICDHLISKSSVYHLSEAELSVLNRWRDEAQDSSLSQDDMAERAAKFQLDAAHSAVRVEIMRQSREAFRQALNQVASTLTLPNDIAELRNRLFDTESKQALASDSTLDEFVSGVVDALKNEAEFSDMRQRYVEKLSKVAAERLDRYVINRLEAAGFYVSKSRGSLDCGPAVLSLASALERVTRNTIISPLHQYMIQNNPRIAGLIKKSPMLREVSLGRVRYALGQPDPSQKLDAEYLALITKWMNEKLDAEKSYFYRVELVNVTDKLALVRNKWAHGGASLSNQDLVEVEAILFPSGRPTVFDSIIL